MSDSKTKSKAQTTETAQTADQQSGTTVQGETQEELREEWVRYDFSGQPVISTRDINVHYGDEHALHDISMDIPENSVTALIGPSGCGKSTFLRCLNRMNDRIKAADVNGEVEFDGKNIYSKGTNLVELRKRIGQVFQSPNPFPKSIRDNVSYGPRKHGDIDVSTLSRLLGRDDRKEEEELVERCLKQAALWDEVKDRLDDNALGLSGGQQQRLCIARALGAFSELEDQRRPAHRLDQLVRGPHGVGIAGDRLAQALAGQ